MWSLRLWRKALYWSVLTAMWFGMTSTCTLQQLVRDGASNPADQYHGWYSFFLTGAIVSGVATVLLIAVAVVFLLTMHGSQREGER